MVTIGYLVLLGVVAAACGMALGLVMLLTNPLEVGPLGVTLWFVGLLLFLAAVFTLVLYGVKRFLKVHSTGMARLRYSWRQGLLLSGGVTGMLALSSLQQFSARDAILLGILLVIVEVYVRFRWP